MKAAIEVRALTPRDERSGFSCGDEDLDRFFHRFAGQNQFRHHIGVTYVAVQDGGIVGFVTVAPAELDIEALPADRRSHLPRYPLPVLRLARLAVDRKARGRGVGASLLLFALRLSRRTADEIGCVGAVVDAKPGAMDFYSRYGFKPLVPLEGALLTRPEPVPMFLPLSAIPRVAGE